VATKQRSRSRRPRTTSERTTRYVAPVLDPNWQSPYAPTASEREENARVVRRFAFRRRLAQTIIVSVVVVALLVGVVVVAWLPILAVLLGAVYAWDVRRAMASFSQRAAGLGSSLLVEFEPGGDATQRLRLVTVLDRLAATFGVVDVSAFVVNDAMYNAALIPDGTKLSLLVTSSLVRDFELIELEGVVAHCLARHRLGLVERESVAAVTTASEETCCKLAGIGMAYRADEVAAASIRYPLGLAGALRKCARQPLVEASFFAGETYARSRWVFFNQWSDRAGAILEDLDDVALRARALEEW